MTARLPEGPSTFSSARVHQILHQSKSKGPVLLQLQRRVVQGHKTSFHPFSPISQPVPNDAGTEYWGDLGPQYEVGVLKEKCRRLQSLAHGPLHFRELDRCMSEWLDCSFRWTSDESEGILVQRAIGVLKRLPSHPPSIENHDTIGLLGELDPDYFVDPSQDHKWENLRVTNWVDGNVIRIVLQMVIDGYGSDTGRDGRKDNSTFIDAIVRHINNVGGLLHHAHRLSQQDKKDDREGAQRWNVVKFFGTPGIARDEGTWQTINRGFTSWLNTSACNDPPDWMCRWSYEAIQNDRASLGLDLRTFCARYRDFARLQGFASLEARCHVDENGASHPCGGTSPFACRRFTGSRVDGVTMNQSAHAWPCRGKGPGCRQLWWDEESYRRAVPAPAVRIDYDGLDEKLEYTKSSETSMSISHVWSHGQGGRVDKNRTGTPYAGDIESLEELTGMNSCLHRRYCDIARAQGCDSYWMDTPCIPSEKNLRKAAIGEINRVFSTSKITLVCDRDVMQIDMSQPTLKTKEILLAVLLASDWNTRAWTFLEAMRGRANIHVLCKGDKVLSLSSLIKDVNQNGSIDIAVLFLTAQHLSPTRGVYPHVPLEEAACLLSHRHASRENDNVIIWGLLAGEEHVSDATSLWRSQMDRGKRLSEGIREDLRKLYPDEHTTYAPSTPGWVVYSGALLSSVPRIKTTRGLSWAPSFPTAFPQPNANPLHHRYPSRGMSSCVAQFDDNFLTCEWLVHEFIGFSALSRCIRAILPLFPATGKEHELSHGIAAKYLRNYTNGAVLRPKHIDFRSNMQAVSPSQIISDESTMLIVGSNDGVEWEWVDICPWQEEFVLSVFHERKMRIRSNWSVDDSWCCWWWARLCKPTRHYLRNLLFSLPFLLFLSTGYEFGFHWYFADPSHEVPDEHLEVRDDIHHLPPAEEISRASKV
ncbi:hypothetical protein BDV97DRAFT_391530 [Delphinella strobiligena]|nr:hypothetical protein BDV97DRAFT_391530 [Delphinella strobiligena]